MNTRTIPTFLLSTLVLAACGDDINIVSTFSYTNVNASNVTSVESWSGGDGTGDSEPVTETAMPPDDTSDVDTTTGESTSEPMAPTTGGADMTTGETQSSPFPPTGCARIVEIAGRLDEEARHVIIDANGCKRSSTMELEFNVFGAPGPFTVTLGAPNGCRTYGGPMSAMVLDGGTLVTITGVDSPPAYEATLFVDGVPSDIFSAPAMLSGNPEWPGHPSAPTTPVRRRYDWSFVDVPAHVPGCGLI